MNPERRSHCVRSSDNECVAKSGVVKSLLEDSLALVLNENAFQRGFIYRAQRM